MGVDPHVLGQGGVNGSGGARAAAVELVSGTS